MCGNLTRGKVNCPGKIASAKTTGGSKISIGLAPLKNDFTCSYILSDSTCFKKYISITLFQMQSAGLQYLSSMGVE